MKTLLKIAKAEIMTRHGFELGDFTLIFTGFEDYSSNSTKSKNSVLARFDVITNGVFEMSTNITLFDYGFVTPKGYKSSKKVPVVISDIENLTSAEVAALKAFKAEYKINTFDPFYAENEANRKNASAWNHIAANYITDPYCTR